MADVKAKNIDKSRLLQEKPTVIVQKTDDHNAMMRYIKRRLAEIEAEHPELTEIEEAEVVEREKQRALGVAEYADEAEAVEPEPRDA